MKHALPALLCAALALPSAQIALAQDKPLPAEQAASTIKLPEGFQATLFAGEPAVVQPIAMTTDDQGRLWVAECLSYPKWEKTGNDRIVWFADKDGDGRHDQRQVFADGLANVSALQWGFGGVWIVATPYLQFIPDKDGDGRADGPPVTLLDGFDLNARHNVAAALTWGPDGWLYGCNGILSNSKLGKPGTAEAERLSINCGVWRYHPTRHALEAVAWGSTNPWGLDYNDVGQFFITNCVIAHLWHVLPGAHFQRMFGQDLNPHSYTLLPTAAEHLHWGGGAWQASRTGQVHSDFGGGHAHSGAMVYLGDNFPASYRDRLFMCNIHGRRLNVDLLERNPSGYTGKRSPDFGFSADPWFRGTAVIAAADGGIFVSDWSDAGECHDYEDIHRDNGRIFKIVYGTPQAKPVDLSKASDEELLDYQTHANDWYGRHARRLLHERAHAKTLAAGTVASAKARLAKETSPRLALRWMWVRHQIEGALPAADLVTLAGHADENVAAWATRLAVDNRSAPPAPEVVKRLVDLAGTTPSPFVRAHLASALQWMPDDARWRVAEVLADRQEDAANGLLGPMLWYGLEPLVPKDPARAVRLAARTPISLVREYVARRLGPSADTVKLLAAVDSPAARRDVVRGLAANVEGMKRVPMPEGWSETSKGLLGSGDPYLEDATLSLSLQFGEPKAVEILRTRAEAKDLSPARRASAIRTLALLKDPTLLPVFVGLLADADVSGPALAAVSPFADPKIADAVVKHYGTWSAGDRRDAVSILAARPEWADKLLDAIAAGTISKGDVSLTVARQLANSKQPGLREKLEKVWGKVRETAAERQGLVAKYRSELPPAAVKAADLAHGQAIYKKTCGNCHALFGEGEKIGPELTGAQRKELEYLLENILDPSAVVATDYQLMIVETKDGRSLSGIVIKETPAAITLQMPAGQTIIPLEDIENRTRPGLSLMPEGLLDTLKPNEVRDLFGYLMSDGPAK